MAWDESLMQQMRHMALVHAVTITFARTPRRGECAAFEALPRCTAFIVELVGEVGDMIDGQMDGWMDSMHAYQHSAGISTSLSLSLISRLATSRRTLAQSARACCVPLACERCATRAPRRAALSAARSARRYRICCPCATASARRSASTCRRSLACGASGSRLMSVALEMRGNSSASKNVKRINMGFLNFRR